ncbi:MAG TPA: hypothetical protein VGB68_02460 [Pyrinomonadaceae bacterium]|jgi:hypothetical protein
MKADEFNQDFELDKKARRGLRAVPKKPVGFPEVLTADGEPFDANQTYFYFDEQARTVRQTDGLRRVDAAWLGSLGFRVVLIEKLRSDRNAALDDGQAFIRNQIADFQKIIESFELEKTLEEI